MGFRDCASYDSLAPLTALDAATPMILAKDFRHIGIDLGASDTAVYTLTVYASDQEARPDLTVAASATNTYSTVQSVLKSNGGSIDGGTGIVVAADGFTRYEINDNAARWVGLKITTYTTGTATVSMFLNDNQ